MECQVLPAIVAILGGFSVASTFLEMSRLRECLDVGGREAGGWPAALERVFVMVGRLGTNSTYAVSKVRCTLKYTNKKTAKL